jgi:hypothetical protein
MSDNFVVIIKYYEKILKDMVLNGIPSDPFIGRNMLQI